MQIKFFTKQKSFKKSGIYTNPHFFWGILLSLAFIFIVASLIFGFFLFQQINKESILETGNINQKTNIVDKNRINKVLDYFANRQKKSSDIINSPSPVIDPSL